LNIVEVNNISKSYHSINGETLALANISFSVNKGEFVSIVGPSGCGKSTLLSIMAGLVAASQGHVLINGKEIISPSPSVGYMLQRDCLFEWRSIYKNAVLGLEINNSLNNESIGRVEHLISAYGLSEFKNKYPSQLSGGMRQRAALIRTLATNPEILLLDEAFSALDYQTRLVVTEDIYKIIKKEGKTAILVTHDIAESISMSDRVIVLSKRPGTVKSIHTIMLSCKEGRTPLTSRNCPEFSYYFNTIWKELDVCEHVFC